MRTAAWRIAWGLALLVSAGPGVGCGGCSRKDGGGSDGASPTPNDAAAVDAASADDEARDQRTRIPRDRCEDVSRRYNVMAGKLESDQSAEVVDMNARCIQNGNLAWYKCTLRARRAPDLLECTQRFLLQPTAPAPAGAPRNQ